MENKIKQKTVMLILTEDCNLACTYCYEHNKSCKKMSYETAKKIIEDELTKEDGFEEVLIEFFGGEPFLEFETIRKLHDYIFSNRWPKKRLCFATTNGTLVHGEMKDWLKKNRRTMYVALSLDGTKQMHDINRCNSYDKIDVNFFKENWPDQTCKMTISNQTLPHLAEGFFYLKDMGFPVSMSMAQGIEWEEENNFKILEEQLQILVDYYIKNPKEKLCDFLDTRLAGAELRKDGPFKWCGTGVQMVAYDPDGNYYPCQAFAPQTLGKEAEKFKNTTLEGFDNDFDDKSCKDCYVYPICRTCYGANYLLFKDYRKRDKTMCRFNKLCLLATANIKYNRYMQKRPEDLTPEDLLELKAIRNIQQLEI